LNIFRKKDLRPSSLRYPLCSFLFDIRNEKMPACVHDGRRTVISPRTLGCEEKVLYPNGLEIFYLFLFPIRDLLQQGQDPEASY